MARKLTLAISCSALLALAPAAFAQTAVMNIVNDFVGIGTETPIAKLHVVKTAHPAPYGGVFATTVSGAVPVFSLDSSPVTGAAYDNPYFSARHRYADGSLKDSAAMFFAMQDLTPGAEHVDFRLNLRQNGTMTEMFRVKGATGYFGLGTNNPQGTLHVNGTIFQTGNGVLHADYVFDADYDLKSIEDHSAFMWNNRHLPGVAPRTVDENGTEKVEIGAQRRGILEELEVAHIYIEQLNERLQDKDSRLVDLESRLARLEAAIN